MEHAKSQSSQAISSLPPIFSYAVQVYAFCTMAHVHPRSGSFLYAISNDTVHEGEPFCWWNGILRVCWTYGAVTGHRGAHWTDLRLWSVRPQQLVPSSGFRLLPGRGSWWDMGRWWTWWGGGHGWAAVQDWWCCHDVPRCGWHWLGLLWAGFFYPRSAWRSKKYSVELTITQAMADRSHAGVLYYFCHIHSKMSGRIILKNADGSNVTQAKRVLNDKAVPMSSKTSVVKPKNILKACVAPSHLRTHNLLIMVR